MVDINLDFRMDDTEIRFGEDAKSLDLEFTAVQTVSENDHSKLTNRTLPDQHPIEAISGLQQELEERPAGRSITNLEINKAWETIFGGN